MLASPLKCCITLGHGAKAWAGWTSTHLFEWGLLLVTILSSKMLDLNSETLILSLLIGNFKNYLNRILDIFKIMGLLDIFKNI
jgi:hypothetical protein